MRSDDALYQLDRATRAIAGELDLDRVLQLIVDGVRELVGAQYAALGIVDVTGRIERFITSGISDALRRSIGPLPEGHGLLGTIIRDGVTLRIPDISKHPDSYGFPPNHPPMHSLLGVPIRVGRATVGNFYLTEKQGASAFSDDDEELVEMFALHAGIAIQNARLLLEVQKLAIVDERLRISRDLHDGIIQSIYAVSLSLEDVPELIQEDDAEAVARVDRAPDRPPSSPSTCRVPVHWMSACPRRPPTSWSRSPGRPSATSPVTVAPAGPGSSSGSTTAKPSCSSRTTAKGSIPGSASAAATSAWRISAIGRPRLPGP